MDLNYAPPAKSRGRVIAVIAAGTFTTALALLGVWLLDVIGGAHIMGWHADYVIPIGAIVVGIAASCGYGIASYVTGLKIRKGLLWSILLLQVGGYFAAQYITFASMGPLYVRGTRHRVTFPEYFHVTATHFAWKKQYGQGHGAPLGGAGYFFIGLEILGFAVGSLIVPGALMLVPYCELCQMYMKTKKLATLAASVPGRAPRKADAQGTTAYENQQRQAFDSAKSKLAGFGQLVRAGDAPTLRQELDALRPTSKAAEKLPVRISVNLVCCPNCYSGHLRSVLLTGQGKQQRSTQLEKTELTPEFVHGLTNPAIPAPAALLRPAA